MNTPRKNPYKEEGKSSGSESLAKQIAIHYGSVFFSEGIFLSGIA